ncbi:MAG: nickel pincer cofactor biosynthesis protein LarC [Planctomycetota bacterium]
MNASTTNATSIYVDAVYGLSGDMFLGAMIGLGAPLEKINATLTEFLPPFHAELAEVTRRGIRAAQFRVESQEEQPPRRTLPDIQALLAAAPISDPARAQALEVFQVLADAEGRVHGMPASEVHFHEVGALDSLVDIIGAVLAVELLAPAQLVFSSLPLGSGQVKTDHGVYPVPAPATLELLAGVPTHPFSVGREVTTPTGAALAKVLATAFGPPPAGQIVEQDICYSAGTQTAPPEDPPNLLRAWRFRPAGASTSSERISVLETNIDHVSGEDAGFLIERLLAEGALDAFLTPTIQKKSRPGLVVTVLCTNSAAPHLERLLFRESGTLGIRVRTTERHVVERDVTTVSLPEGKVRVKCAISGDGERHQARPEYEDLRQLSLQTGEPLQALRERVLAEFWRKHG